MWTLEFQGDAEFPKRVEPLFGEEVDEEFPSGRVVPLRDEAPLFVEAEDAPLDQMVQHLRMRGVHFLTENTFVTVKEASNALA